ncbi:hypothetical protein AG1IA_06188 [Rhizoctonia solani AG-1 IA]|uniref:Uncharacterized protein n=1 Tax=Thanatephorus cucumeris (strain AG1-IA) TaxID=983506 RepID=L8WP97_THACA|nr:hypothetical protein AG1IA_06188 [Rhizoctonia solani AG-1 IA]
MRVAKLQPRKSRIQDFGMRYLMDGRCGNFWMANDGLFRHPIHRFGLLTTKEWWIGFGLRLHWCTLASTSGKLYYQYP